MTLAGELAGLLSPYLPAQRWFAGRGRPLRGIAVERAVQLHVDGLLHVVARVDYGDGGTAERYQVPLALGPPPARPQGRPPGVPLGVVSIGGEPVEVYDAMRDARLVLGLVDRMAAGADDAGLRFRHAGDPEALRAHSVRPLGAEQSNTSVVLDDRLILKVFRRLEPGVNPDLELTRALAGQGFEAIATPLGWVEAEDGTTMVVVQRYHAGAVEGWALATERSRAWRQGDPDAHFDAEARALGEVTAALHRSLAAALGTWPAGAGTPQAEYDRRVAELDEAVAAAPALRTFRDRIVVLYDAARTAEAGAALQRVHGDYHLGQVLRVADGRWVVLDFEGEPARPVAERRRPASPLRDVAGMLRSVDYAAYFPTPEVAAGARGDGGSSPRPAGPGAGRPSEGKDETARRAAGWAARARAAFLAGYGAGYGAGADRGATGAALRGFELEKAVYEVSYEARYRPDWLPIPLGGIARLLDADDDTAEPGGDWSLMTGSER